MSSLNSNQDSSSGGATVGRENEAETATGVAVQKEMASSNLENCIPLWQQIFPWMHYEETTNMFICYICEWGSIDPRLIKIFQIKSPKDVHLVAKMLRQHKDSKQHLQIERRRQSIYKLCEYLYPFLKTFSEYPSYLEEIIGNVRSLGGGIFPGPQDPTAALAIVGYTCKRIAECIEEDLLNSLTRSPYFSILTHSSNEYAVIRWINSKGESEEHLFSSHIGFPGQNMNCLNYLGSRSIDLSKLVSFTVLSDTSKTVPASVIHCPVRCPDLENFITWVHEASFMKDLFEHLNILTKLCKTSFHKFAAFPEASDLMSIEEPFSYNCILSEKIVTFFFQNLTALKEIACDIHKKTRNMDAYGFSSLELKNPETMFRCALMFHKLQVILETVFVGNTDGSYGRLQKFNSDICDSMKKNDYDSDEYLFLSLFNIFISHLLVSIPAFGSSVVDVLTKKFDCFTERDVEYLLPNLLKESKPLGVESLYESFMSLQKCVKVDEDSPNVMESLESLSCSIELQKKFPELCALAEKVKVLPCFPAALEQSLFNVASLQMFLTGHVSRHLKHPLSLIVLEGPLREQFNVDKVLEMWARKWKAGTSNKSDIIETDIWYKI